MVSTLTSGTFIVLKPKKKCHVIGKGDPLKAHKDTPQSQDMFGSLVVILPTLHEGGQFILHQGEKEWTIDFTDKLATATEPSVCFIAFLGDIEHEALPVMSGYWMTLMYNLYHKPLHPGTSLIPTPFQLKLKQVLVDLVNDKSKLPKGSYLGFGLIYKYAHTGHKLLKLLLGQLKGIDCMLANVCDKLGLRHSLRLLYHEIADPCLNLITTKEFDPSRNEEAMNYESTPEDYLWGSLVGSFSSDSQANVGRNLKFWRMAVWRMMIWRRMISMNMMWKQG